ncbi:retrovirus-related pol polyprotein from transposon TNT 1-94 [Tanacetum coccineum]
MLGKIPNKVYDHFLKAGLGYTNPVRLKKAIAAQPKMYVGDLLHNNKLGIHTIDSEETLEDAEESRNKMRHKTVQIDYEKLNALYEIFTLREIKKEPIEEVQEMLNIFVSMKQKVNDKSPIEYILENEIDRLLEASLTSEIQNYVLLSVEQQKHELLKVELEKSSSASRDIQANLLKRIKILENDFQISQAQSIDFELKLQHQKEKIDCDVSWKAKLSTLHDENVLLKQQVESTVIQLVLWIVDSECLKHMTGNLQLLRNFVEKFIGTVHFGNDHFAAITGYGDYVQGNLTIFHVYYVEDIGHNLFSVGQFCDSDLGDEAPDMIIDFVYQVQRNLKALILTIQTNNKTEFKNKKLRAFYAKLGIVHKTLIARTPQQNGVVERRNRTLVEAARTMLIFSKALEFMWAEAIATACFTQNRSIVYTRHNKTTYELIRGRKPNVQYFYVFGSLCYLTNDHDELGKMKPNADIVLNEVVDEFIQEDVVNFDGNMFHNAPPTPEFDFAESSSTYHDPSNMHQFYHQHRSIDRWTKNHPLKQVIGDPSKPVMIRKRLQTDVKVCMYALTVSTIELKNIKEAMLDHSWIESMQDELNQFKRLDVWELVKCPVGRNIIKVKWIWKNKTDAKNIVIRNKSRLVAKGYGQEEGIDFEFIESQPHNWPPSMSSRVLNRTVKIAEPPRNHKPFLKPKDLACPTCKKCIYSANHDECILKYLSKVNSHTPAQKKDARSHKTTKRYMSVEKKSDSKKHDIQIPIGQKFSSNKSLAVVSENNAS